MSQVSLSRTQSNPTPLQDKRASMPVSSRAPDSTSPPAAASSFVNQTSAESPVTRQKFEPTPEEDEEEHRASKPASLTDTASKRKSRSGTMNKDFRFPSPVSSPVVSETPGRKSTLPSERADSPPSVLQGDISRDAQAARAGVVTPSNIEVPPPPPVEKERSTSSTDDGDEDVGDTVEVDLN